MDGRTLIGEVSEILRDPRQRQWSLSRLTTALNEAFATLCTLKPDAYTVLEDIPLVGGRTEQVIPADAHAIVDVLHNVINGQRSRVVSLVDQAALDAVVVDWHTHPSLGYVKHWMKDEMNDRILHVYPQADTSQSTSIRAKLAKVPCIVDGSPAVDCSSIVIPDEPVAPVAPAAPVATGVNFIEANIDENNGGTGNLSADGLVLTSTNNVNNGYLTAHTIDEGVMTGSGRFYWESEILVDSPGESNAVGIGVPNAAGTFLGSVPDQWGVFNANGGRLYINSATTSIPGLDLSAGDIVGHYLDLDAGTYSFSVNGGALLSIATGLDVSLGYYAMMSVSQSASLRITFNEADLSIALPEGYSTVSFVDPAAEAAYQMALTQHNADLAQFDEDLAAHRAALNEFAACMGCDPEVFVPDFPEEPVEITPESQAAFDQAVEDYYNIVYAKWIRDASCDGTLPDAPVAPGPAPVIVPHDVTFVASGAKTFAQDSNAHLATTLSGNAMKNRGQWYWEMVIDVFNPNMTVGIAQMGIVDPFSREGTNFLGRLRQEFGLFPDGNWREFNQIEDTQTGYAQGDVIGFKMDLDTYTLEYNINGGPFIELGDSNNVSEGVFSRGTWVPAASTFSVSSITVRTDADEFTGTVPDGYLPIGLPGGLDSYDGEFEVQQSDTDVPPFNEEGYLPIRNDSQDPANNLLGHYRFFNIPGPRPEWNPTQIATISATLTNPGQTDVRATRQLRDSGNNNLLFNDPSLQAGSEYIGYSAGSNFIARDLDYVRDFQTETPVTPQEVDAHAALVARFMADQAAFDAAVAAAAAHTAGENSTEELPAGSLTIDSDIPVDKIYYPFLREWMLYRSYCVDDEMTPNYGRAAQHFQRSFNLLGLRVQGKYAIQQVRETIE